MNKMLITTMLKFVLWDGKKAHVLHEGDLSKGNAHYNSITWNRDELFVSAAIDTKYVIRVFDRNFESNGILPDADLHETHQIYWYGDRLYVTNTGLNRIEIMDNLAWSYKAWNGAGLGPDMDHINGIWSDGQQFYISEFRNRDTNRSTWLNQSRIRICNQNLNPLHFINIGDGIHNVYHENGYIYTLISKTPMIFSRNITYGLASAKYPLPVKSNALIRGLARTKYYWYIGVSRCEPDHDKRHVGDAIVLQLDNAFNEVDRLTLPDFGPVCDIRVIDEADFAHNGIML